MTPEEREREAGFYWGRTTFLAYNVAFVARSAELCCQEANDRSLKREARRWAAALMFGAWVKPGFTTEDMRKAIPASDWLDECRLMGAGSGGGGYPFLYNFGSKFRLDLFPDDNDPVGWTIYFTLSRTATGRAWEEPTSVEEVGAFLRGTHQDRSLRILDFTMFYPLPGCEGVDVEEAHGPKGVGVMIRPTVPFGEEWPANAVKQGDPEGP
jgi:hypothetical protein